MFLPFILKISFVQYLNREKAIFFSPYTIVDDEDNIGFIGQVQDQFAMRHYPSLALSYQFIPGTVPSALTEVNFLRDSNPLFADNLKKIIIGRHEEKISTFAIYGVHGVVHPNIVSLIFV